jgi:hypothetical protein
MAPRKKPGKQLYIRMDTNIHARVAKTAKALGMDINGLLNLIIRSHLPQYEARVIWSGDARIQHLRRLFRELVVKLSAHLGAGAREVDPALLAALKPLQDEIDELEQDRAEERNKARLGTMDETDRHLADDERSTQSQEGSGQQ